MEATILEAGSDEGSYLWIAIIAGSISAIAFAAHCYYSRSQNKSADAKEADSSAPLVSKPVIADGKAKPMSNSPTPFVPTFERDLSFFKEEMRKARRNCKTLHEELLRIWNMPSHKLPINVDLPRLARRICIIPQTAPAGTLAEREENFLPDDLEGLSETQREARRVSVLCNTILTVAKTMDGEHESEALIEELGKLERDYKAGKGGDLGMALQYIFERTNAHSTHMMRVFKAVQQRIIFPAAYNIKGTVIEADVMTKDLHTPRAWRIFIDFSELADDVIHVVHTRRECSSSYDPAKYFEVEWQLTMTFDGQMENFVNAELKAVDLVCAPSMESATQDALHSLLF